MLRRGSQRGDQEQELSRGCKARFVNDPLQFLSIVAIVHVADTRLKFSDRRFNRLHMITRHA
jgi:hypothetical protein